MHKVLTQLIRAAFLAVAVTFIGIASPQAPASPPHPAPPPHIYTPSCAVSSCKGPAMC